VSREEPVTCSGCGFGAQQQIVFSFGKNSNAAGTLLGPETTPGVVLRPVEVWGVVLLLHLGGGVWCLICG